MFGGFDGTGYLNDTWTFDGVSWTLVATDTPLQPALAAQMAYDGVTREVVLFGGYDGTIIWETRGCGWATSQWTQAAPAHIPRL